MAFFFGKKESTTPPTAPQNPNQLTNTRIIRTLKTDLIELDAQQKDGAVQKNDKASFVTFSQPSFPEPREVSTQSTDSPQPRQTLEKEKILINPFTQTAVQAPTPTPTPPSPEQPSKGFSVIKPIHTYTSDVAENIQKQHATISDMVQAEEMKRRNEPVSTPHRGLRVAVNIILFVLGFGLIGGAGYLVYRFAVPKNNTQNIAINPVKTELFKIDATETANFIPEKKKIEDAVISMINKTQDGEMRKITFLKTGDSTDVKAQDVLSGLEVEQPELLSSITPGIIIGNFKKNGINGPFIVLKAKNPETTYQSLIKWERDLFRDLQNIFVQDKAARVLPPFFGSTATGFRYQFEDGAIQSKDIRIARDASNQPVILYGFLDQEYILITTNGEVFKEVFSRFTKARYVQ